MNPIFQVLDQAGKKMAQMHMPTWIACFVDAIVERSGGVRVWSLESCVYSYVEMAEVRSEFQMILIHAARMQCGGLDEMVYFLNKVLEYIWI